MKFISWIKKIFNRDTTTLEQVEREIDQLDVAKSDVKYKSLYRADIMLFADELNFDLTEMLNKQADVKKWAYVLHNTKTIRPHYHVYLRFGDKAVSVDVIAKWFGIKSDFVSSVSCSESTYLYYLLKDGYKLSDVVSNFDVLSAVAK